MSRGAVAAWLDGAILAQEFDVVVVGGGIAGLTAGLTSARLGRNTMVLTGDVLGGQLLSIEKIDGVPGYPDGVAGYDLGPITQEQAANAGAQFETASVDRIEKQGDGWLVATGAGDYLARAVIIATGARLKTLGVPGEERLQGKGVSQCASCDAPLLRGRVVAVVGGGDSAMQEGLTLADSASRVIMLQRGAALTGQAAYRERVTGNPKIEVRFNAEVEEILGEANVTGLRVREGSAHGQRRGGCGIRFRRAAAEHGIPARAHAARSRRPHCNGRGLADRTYRHLRRRQCAQRIPRPGGECGRRWRGVGGGSRSISDRWLLGQPAPGRRSLGRRERGDADRRGWSLTLSSPDAASGAQPHGAWP